MDKQSDRKMAEHRSSLFRRLITGEIALNEENDPCNTPRSSRIGSSLHRICASTSGSKATSAVSPEEYVGDPSSILSLQPWIFKRSGSRNEEGKTRSEFIDKCGHQIDDFTDSPVVEISPRSLGLSSGPGRGRSALRSRRSRRQLIKPLTSMENCSIPQLYNEKFRNEEYKFGPFPSPATARPFIVTDGRKIISKSSFELMPVPFDTGLQEEVHQDRSRMAESVVGVSPLPVLRKSKWKNGEMHQGVSNSQRSSNQSYSHVDRMLIFSTGISIGILSSSLSNKKEVDTLKDTLKRKENLVQDLQEELEMKDSMTVKELPNEASGGQQDEHSQTQVMEVESMSKIEAELEAELERLELNMASHDLERRMSDLSEVDSELIGDVVQGELKVDMVHHDPGDFSCESDHRRDSKGSSAECVHETAYPVSPRELSLRLHKVIQHRLEGRIKELESALAQSQKQLQMQMMESERVFSERTCSNSDMASSSNQESPVFIQDMSSLTQPFCLNLAGDALDAYDEAYEEFMRIADFPYTAGTNGEPQESEEHSVDRNLIWGMEDGSARKLKRGPSWERILKNSDMKGTEESDGDGEDEFDDDDHDDDDSKLLIQQIVERTKQGSPVLIHAQRMLFSVDE